MNRCKARKKYVAVPASTFLEHFDGEIKEFQLVLQGLLAQEASESETRLFEGCGTDGHRAIWLCFRLNLQSQSDSQRRWLPGMMQWRDTLTAKDDRHFQRISVCTKRASPLV